MADQRELLREKDAEIERLRKACEFHSTPPDERALAQIKGAKAVAGTLYNALPPADGHDERFGKWWGEQAISSFIDAVLDLYAAPQPPDVSK
jgi:hypothetical protein